MKRVKTKIFKRVALNVESSEKSLENIISSSQKYDTVNEEEKNRTKCRKANI